MTEYFKNGKSGCEDGLGTAMEMTGFLEELPTAIAESVLLDKTCVRILDRRIFPLRKEFVVCKDIEDIARSIEEMVTQSAGPFFAASAGMVLAARTAMLKRSESAKIEYMQAAAERLLQTRPTNNNIRDVVSTLMVTARCLVGEADYASHIEAEMYQLWKSRYLRSRLLGEYAAGVITEGDVILTHCWADISLIDTLRAAMRAGKNVSVICLETRPYLQGSRLTAHSVAEIGIEATVITDNMGACAMDTGMVTRVITAADRVTLSGHVINKVGTYQIAIAARHFKVPYLALVQVPDRAALTPDDVVIEERDGNECLKCLGISTASPLAKGWYPAFDVTPPEYVSAIATVDGVFSPIELNEIYGSPQRDCHER